jgi:NTE family protein
MRSAMSEAPNQPPSGGTAERADDLVVGHDAPREPEPGIALCLSGGGYRAMLFHAGALWRLGEAGLLGEVARVSSVSGGSLTAGALALAWPRLVAEGFAGEAVRRHVVDPLRRQADRTVDVRAVLAGLLLPGRTVSDRVARGYRGLLGDATLQDLPAEPPRFTFNATNLQSAVLFRFSRAYAWDYRVGRIDAPRLLLRTVVAASSAFPPLLSPATVPVTPADFVPGSGEDLEAAAYRTNPVLSDGGVYDNLGLETAWKRYATVLVSDGGGKTAAAPRVRRNWASQTERVLMTIDNQVRSLRKRALIASYVERTREGAYWGVRSHIADYGLGVTLPCPDSETLALAQTPTRLRSLPAVAQKRLINWGYAICDAAIRAHVRPQLPAPAAFPYPAAGVGPGARS